MLQNISKHKYRLIYTTITSVIFAGLILLFRFLKNKYNLNCYEITFSENQQEFFIFGISLNNWGVIIAIMATIFGVPWGLHQYDSARREKQQEKASEIANQFALELIEDITIIGEFLKNYDKLNPIYSNIDLNKLKRFDIYEIENISNKKNLSTDFMEIIKSTETNDSFHKYVEKTFPEKAENLKKVKFSHYMTKTLNRLEAISINISNNAAGTEYIYPSLHQVLLPFIEKCSLYISSNNGNYTYKYFINIIDVYNNWKAIRKKEQLTELKQKEKIDSKTNKYRKKTEKYHQKINKIMDKTLDKKPRKL